MLILGIDPGTAITGYGVVHYQGNKFRPVDYNCIRTSSKLPLAERLRLLYAGITDVLRSYKPEHFSVEALFFNKNTSTAMAVGQARGVILLAAAHWGLEVYEYTPLQVKQAVVGNGSADKGQVQFMVKTILNLPEIPRPDDVADALAISICHAHHRTGWGAIL
ncbi:MAG: crossover junction endodeoxyribonuclease RuvC [Firmicutes bacterium]|nr:crossover junction endodeoxyribonuclease RuvC [Bacillota bacterium]